jgi:hypothetical protein
MLCMRHSFALVAYQAKYLDEYRLCFLNSRRADNHKRFLIIHMISSSNASGNSSADTRNKWLSRNGIFPSFFYFVVNFIVDKRWGVSDYCVQLIPMAEGIGYCVRAENERCFCKHTSPVMCNECRLFPRAPSWLSLI